MAIARGGSRRSSDHIEMPVMQNVTRRQVMDVLGATLAVTSFFSPLDERREQLEQIPWVESAAVMRFVRTGKVTLLERTPGRLSVSARNRAIDNTGHIMEIPAHN